MKKITVTLNVDEYAARQQSGLSNLEDAILKELDWLRDSGMVVEALSLREPEKEQPKVFCLCEEHEDSDAIREFYIRAISTDKKSLRKLMEAKIQSDEYGFIAQKGVDDHSLDHFSTNFNDGFVEYYIVEEDVLSRDDVEKLVQSELGETVPANGKLPLEEQISKANAAQISNARQPSEGRSVSEQGREQE